MSPTFHGRDILAPLAAHLSLGEDPRNLGQLTQEWVRLETKSPILENDVLIGEVIFIDHFGNLITNIPGSEFARLSEHPFRLVVGDQVVTQRVRTYGEAKAGTAVALISSLDLLEVALTNGNAAEKLGAQVGTRVSVRVASYSDPGK